MTDIEFATRGLAGAQKLEVWRAVLADVFGPFELQASSRERFDAAVRCWRRAQLQFNDIAYCWQYGERTAGHVARLNQETYLLTRPVQGRLHVERAGGAFVLEPGFFYLFNQTLPFRFAAEAGYHSFSVSIPAAALRLREPRLEPVYRLADADGSARGRLLRDYIEHVAAGAREWSEPEALGLGERLVDLVILLMVQPRDAALPASDSAVKAVQRNRAVAWIRAHLADPDLDPARIARGCGISPSYLHQVFAAGGLKVEEYVYAQRLARLRELLADPCQRGRSIAQLAYQVGFRHPAHCTRRFKERYGATPREYRASVQHHSG